MALQGRQHLDVAGLDAAVEQRGRRRELRGAQGFDDPRATRDEDRPRLGAELAGAQGEGGDELGGDVCAALGGRRGGHEDGVVGAQLPVERDRLRAGVGHVEEGAAAGDRAGEARCLDARVLQRRGTCRSARDKCEDAGRHACCGKRAGDGVGRGDRKFRVAGVCLEDDGVARGPGGGGVPACHGEGEREVAGGEDKHRADRLEHAAQVRAGCPHGPLRVGVVDAGVEVAAVAQHLAEEAQLEGGALELAGEAGLRQVGLRHGDRDEGAGRGIEGIRDGVQHVGAR